MSETALYLSLEKLAANFNSLMLNMLGQNISKQHSNILFF